MSCSTVLTCWMLPWGWYWRKCDLNLVAHAGPLAEMCMAVASFYLASEACQKKSWHSTAFGINVLSKTIQPNQSLRHRCLNRVQRPSCMYFLRLFHSSSPKQYLGWLELTRSMRGSGTLNENHSLSSKLIRPKRSSCISVISPSVFW